MIVNVPIVKSEPEPPNDTFIEKIMAEIFKLIGWYNIGSGKTPKYFYSAPGLIEIDYLETVTIDLVWGVNSTDPDKKPWHRFQKPVFPEFTIYYEAVYPEDIPQGAFKAVFDPPMFDVREYDEQVGGTDAQATQVTTKLNLTLDIPPDPNNAIQDFILQINVSIYRKYGNLIGIFRLGAFFGGFWRVNYQAEIGRKTFFIHVKVQPFRNAEIYMPSAIEMDLNDLKSATVKVQNRGSHVEQFGFRVSGEGDSLLVNTPPPITLYPGEIGFAEVGLVTKPLAYDRGTLHNIRVDLYAYDQPDVILSHGDLTVKTQGIALQGIFSFKYSWHLFFIIIGLLLLLIIYTIYRRIKYARITKKPPKPWTFPEEKEYLKNLIEKNKNKEYKKTIERMKEEYESSILWYYYYRKAELKKESKDKKLNKTVTKIKRIFSNISDKLQKIKEEGVKKKEKKSKEKKILEEKPIEEKPIKKVETVSKSPINKEAELAKKKKLKALEKIRKKQIKQKNKLAGYY
jgi:hypothetical protein